MLNGKNVRQNGKSNENISATTKEAIELLSTGVLPGWISEWRIEPHIKYVVSPDEDKCKSDIIKSVSLHLYQSCS